MCFKIKRLGNDTPLRAIAHPLASPPGSAAPRVRHALWDQNCTYRARDMGSEVAAARLLFLAFKKNVSLRACSARGQWRLSGEFIFCERSTICYTPSGWIHRRCPHTFLLQQQSTIRVYHSHQHQYLHLRGLHTHARHS